MRTSHPSLISLHLNFSFCDFFIFHKGVTKRSAITISTAYHTIACWFKIRTYHDALSLAVNNI